MKEHPGIALATIKKEGNPALRVFQIMKTEKGKHLLYFTTSPEKEGYRELYYVRTELKHSIFFGIFGPFNQEL